LRVRASERERDETIRVLNDGCADGRLSTATHEERIERALAAKTVDELRQLTMDVPRVLGPKAWLSKTLVPAIRRRVATAQAPCLWLDGIGFQPFVVGRSPRADLVMTDETVSRRHAHIVRTPDGFMLADLGSTNGTWLGGRRVGQVEIAAGDVVLLGDAALRLL
jgi:hypothetical protein